MQAKSILVKAGTEQVVALVRELDRQCLDADSSARLRAAVTLYTQNGGVLPVRLTPEPVGEGAPVSQVQLQRHRVLDEGFRLQSRAFMLTFNSKAFTAGTWERFRTWVQGTARRLHASRWAACLEESQHAQASADASVFHTHAYLWWTDGKGVRHRNTDEFVFDAVRPRGGCLCPLRAEGAYFLACSHARYVVRLCGKAWNSLRRQQLQSMARLRASCRVGSWSVGHQEADARHVRGLLTPPARWSRRQEARPHRAVCRRASAGGS